MNPYRAFKRLPPAHLIIILGLVTLLVLVTTSYILSENLIYHLQEILATILWQFWQIIEQVWQTIGWNGCSAIATGVSALAALLIAIDTWLKRREPPPLPPPTQRSPQIELQRASHSEGEKPAGRA